MSLVRALGAALLVIASAVPSSPAAAAGDGALVQLNGRAGCLSVAGKFGCTRARALDQPGQVAVSPGGGSVYVTSMRSDTVAVFRRSRSTGRLRQLPGAAGCVRQRGGRGCRFARGMRDPWTIVVSRDGRNVYLTSLGSRAIVVFRRNLRTGALRQLRGRAGCVHERGAEGCRTGRALAGVSSLALSPSGRFLYAGSERGIAAFRRGPRTGRLTQLPGAAGCVATGGRLGCEPGRAVDRLTDVAVARDGANVYAASTGHNAVSVFDRRPGGGLRQLAGPAGCISHLGDGGCTAAGTLLGVSRIAVSPRGADSVYAGATFSGAVANLAREAATGALSQPPGPLGCIRDGGGLGCAAARLMEEPEDVVLSRDGRNAYVTALGSLVVLSREAATGQLAQLPGRAGCIAGRPPMAGCTSSRRLSDPSAVALSRDGRHGYVTWSETDAVAVYRRAR